MSAFGGVVDFLRGLGESNRQIDLDDVRQSVLGVPTLFDLLYDVTEKPGFKTVADLLRPTEADIGMSAGPLAIGRLGRAVSAKAVQKLYQEAAGLQSVKDIDTFSKSFREWLQHSFKPTVEMPVEEYLMHHLSGTQVVDPVSGVVIKNPLDTMFDFTGALTAVPEKAIRGLKRIELMSKQPAGHPPLTMASHFPRQRAVEVYPSASRTIFSMPQLVQSTVHEIAHHIASRAGRGWNDPGDYQKIVNYLQNTAGWNLKKTQNPFGDLYVPTSYDDLSSLFYKTGWPEKPVPRESWEKLVKHWGTYFLHHPIEDLAETIAYSLLRRSPKYSKMYASQIQALEANKRVAVDNLLALLGVFD